MNFTVQVKQEIPIRRISDLLCCAFEGGSNYWYVIEEFGHPDGFPNTPDEEDRKYRHLSFPTNPGGFLAVSDAKQADGGDARIERLHLKALERGLQVMADKYPRHFGNFMQDNEDAETGDVFLQCCLYGEVVYG